MAEQGRSLSPNRCSVVLRANPLRIRPHTRCQAQKSPCRDQFTTPESHQTDRFSGLGDLMIRPAQPTGLVSASQRPHRLYRK